MTNASILDVDLLAFEHGSPAQRSDVVEAVRASLQTGFVYTAHDLGEDMLDRAYGLLGEFFDLDSDTKASWERPESHGQTGYTGLLVETAASSEVPDWKEMLNWGAPAPIGHPLRSRYPHRYSDPVLPESDVPGIHDALMQFHQDLAELQRRFLRVIAVGVGAHETYFDTMLEHGASLTRAIRYPTMDQAPVGGHVWAGAHADINLITALPRATARGLQVKTETGWVDAAPPDGHVIINTGMMLERITNGMIPPGIHRVVADPGQSGSRMSVVQFCHPTPWTALAPLQACITETHPQRWPAMMAADALDQVLWEINLVDGSRRIGNGEAGSGGAE